MVWYYCYVCFWSRGYRCCSSSSIRIGGSGSGGGGDYFSFLLLLFFAIRFSFFFLLFFFFFYFYFCFTLSPILFRTRNMVVSVTLLFFLWWWTQWRWWNYHLFLLLLLLYQYHSSSSLSRRPIYPSPTILTTSITIKGTTGTSSRRGFNEESYRMWVDYYLVTVVINFFISLNIYYYQSIHPHSLFSFLKLDQTKLYYYVMKWCNS